MAIRRREGSPYWWYSFTVNGRRFRGSTGTETRKTAELIEAKLRDEALLGTVMVKRPSMTLDEAAGRWWLEAGADHSNAKTEKQQLGVLLDLLGKSARLEDIDDRTVSDLVPRLRARRRGTALVSPATVNRYVELLKRVMNRASKAWKVQVGDVDWSVHRLREAAIRERYLSPEEADRLIAEAATHLRPAIRFSLYTGVRLANCMTLDWSQISMSRREVTFRTKSDKPGGAWHVIDLAGPCIGMLASLEPKKSGPVFTRDGKPIRSWRTAWRAALRRAQIADFRWHDLRHTAASWMVQQGVDIDIVKDILGHSDISTTLRYAKRKRSATRDAIASLAAHPGHNTPRDVGYDIDLKEEKS